MDKLSEIILGKASLYCKEVDDQQTSDREKTAGGTEAWEDEVLNVVFDKNQAVCKRGIWRWERTLREGKVLQESCTTLHRHLDPLLVSAQQPKYDSTPESRSYSEQLKKARVH